MFGESGSQAYRSVTAGAPHHSCVAAHIVALGLKDVDLRTVTESGGLGQVHVFGDGDWCSEHHA